MSNPSASDGWCPFATRYSTGKYWEGNQGRRAVVMHIAQGGYEAAVNWLSNDVSNPNSSAHFVIAKDGRIAQLISINNSAWANGLRWANGHWYTPADPPRLENPSWVDIVPGVNPNLYTISIEHEGYYQEKWTPEMYAANTRLLKWIAEQLGQPGAPLQWVAHRNLIGHNEIDPIDRANCPGPNVNLAQIASDANGGGLVTRVVPQASVQHIYGTTMLVSLPSYTLVKQLTETDIPVSGYLDFNGTRWYISQYSYQNQISNFFDSAACVKPVQDITATLSLNPGNRDLVVPGAEELKQLGAKWVRFLLPGTGQNMQTGQNAELDWLMSRFQGLGIKYLVLINPETLNENPPAHGSSSWGDANSGYIGRVAGLAQKITSYYKGRISAIEIFNEPNVQGIVAEDYGALLNACYAKIKAVNNLPVISAGICCGENFDYLRRVAAVSRGSYDGTGWHAYAERVDGYPFATFGFGELRYSLAAARAIGGKPLWLTEIGAQLDWNWGPGSQPAEAVASYLTRAYNLIRYLGRDVVAEAFWFTWKIPGESWGLVDDAGNRRPAWYAFQKEAGIAPPPPGAPTVTGVSLSPIVLEGGMLLNVSITVKNESSKTLTTQGPDPGFIYDEGSDFRSLGFSEQSGAFRVGIDFEGRTGIDHPYRWGLGAPLAPGQSTTVKGSIRVKNASEKNYWAGFVQEYVAWLQDNLGTCRITVMPKSDVPVGTKPVITSVSLSPAEFKAGNLLNVAIVVRNDSSATLQTQKPDPGYVYVEGDTFPGQGFGEQRGAYRVGIDFDGRTGIDHPYRWGLGAPLPPGQLALVKGSIRLNSPQTRKYWAGLVQELIAWVQDNEGAQTITVTGPTPPAGKASITFVEFSPESLAQGGLLQVRVTVTNGTNSTLTTQGPQPGFVYTEGDTFAAKQYPPVPGAFRIGLDWEGRVGDPDHPYRWGLGAPLGPGQSTTISGYVRLTRRQTTNFYVGLVQEGISWVQDHVAKTCIEVLPS